jgi:uncharacterized OsmC-like protein
MTVTAILENGFQHNEIELETDGSQKQISIPPRPDGKGLAVNGGELLFLSLATCICNDTYREGARRNIPIESVNVTASGNFSNEGEPASQIWYKVSIKSPAPQEDIAALIDHVDHVAEIHNTLRKGAGVLLMR